MDGLLQHPQVSAISFVGSKRVARYIYAQAAKYGKRVQCQCGAKNHMVVMPDADGRNYQSVGGNGNFVGPTLIADVPAQSAAATEEIFGPVLNSCMPIQ